MLSFCVFSKAGVREYEFAFKGFVPGASDELINIDVMA